ncbi:MAG: serpin family protein, partial [bacterium]
MKNGKRVIAAALAGILTVGSLAGCGGASQSAASTPGTVSGSTPAASDGKTVLLAAANLPITGAYPVSDKYFDEEAGEFHRDEYQKDSDAWDASVEERQALAAAAKNGYTDFLTDLSKLMLNDENVTNPAFSPLNIYLSLGMLAEISEGETRAQLLKAAHASSLDSLYETANALAKASRRGDDAQTVDLGGSMWLSNKINFNDEVVKKTAERYFASIYRGEFGTETMDQEFRKWLNEKTGGLLRNQVNNIKFDNPDLALVLATTIYLKAVWADEFSENDTKEQVFHGKSGDKEVSFMHKSGSGTVCYGEKFSAIWKAFVSGGGMYLILPNEGTSPEELLDDPEAKQFLTNGADGWKNSRSAMVNLSLPKFDVTSEYDLKEILTQMGIEDAFDSKKANFSSLSTNGTSFVLDKSMHDARVKVNEHGVEAAAFTVYTLATAALI